MPEQFVDVFGEDVAFDVEPIAGLAGGEIGGAEGMRNDGHFHESRGDGSHGQADAVDGDGTFVNQKPVEIGGNANDQFPIAAAELTEGFENAGAIHVALYDV